MKYTVSISSDGDTTTRNLHGLPAALAFTIMGHDMVSDGGPLFEQLARIVKVANDVADVSDINRGCNFPSPLDFINAATVYIDKIDEWRAGFSTV